jgi:hypothetical protein
VLLVLADDIVAKLEAGAVAGAYTWISESSPPHGSESRFEDGWFAGVRDAASYLLRIADTTATGCGRAASSALLDAHVQQVACPAPEETAADEPAPAPDPVPLEAKDVLVAADASRGPWPRRGRATGRTGRTSWTSR